MAHRMNAYIREIYSNDDHEDIAAICERFLEEINGIWYLKEKARPDCRAWCSEMLDMMFPDDSKAIKHLIMETVGEDEVESILEDIINYCTPEEEELCGWCAESGEDCKCDEIEKKINLTQGA
jgi:hypothetical protein